MEAESGPPDNGFSKWDSVFWAIIGVASRVEVFELAMI